MNQNNSLNNEINENLLLERSDEDEIIVTQNSINNEQNSNN